MAEPPALYPKLDPTHYILPPTPPTKPHSYAPLPQNIPYPNVPNGYGQNYYPPSNQQYSHPTHPSNHLQTSPQYIAGPYQYQPPFPNAFPQAPQPVQPNFQQPQPNYNIYNRQPTYAPSPNSTYQPQFIPSNPNQNYYPQNTHYSQNSSHSQVQNSSHSQVQNSLQNQQVNQAQNRPNSDSNFSLFSNPNFHIQSNQGPGQLKTNSNSNVQFSTFGGPSTFPHLHSNLSQHGTQANIPANPEEENIVPEEETEEEEHEEVSTTDSRNERKLMRAVQRCERTLNRLFAAMNRKNKSASIHAHEKLKQEVQEVQALAKYGDQAESKQFLQQVQKALDYFENEFQLVIQQIDQEREQTLNQYKKSIVDLQQDIMSSSQQLQQALKQAEKNAAKTTAEFKSHDGH